MGQEDFQKLKSAGLKGDIEHCSRELFAYDGSKIDVIGHFEADISVGKAKVTSSFVILSMDVAYWVMLLQRNLVSFTLGQRPVFLVAIVMKLRVPLPTSSMLN